MKHVDDKYTLTWEQIELAERCNPEHQWTARRIINEFLGYLPSRIKCVPFLPFIQTLVDSYTNGQLSHDNYRKELEFHLRVLRNSEFKKHWWVIKKKYDESDYKIYNTELLIKRDHAREAICSMLCYTPDLEYSLHAEMMLRRLYQSDEEDFHILNGELFALATTMYRTIYIAEGEQAADNCPLLGLMLHDGNDSCPINRAHKK